MLTITSRLDVMHRLGRAMADPTRSRILMTLLHGPRCPAVLSREPALTRSYAPNHLTALRDWGVGAAAAEHRQNRNELPGPHLAAGLTALVEVARAAGEHAPCVHARSPVPGGGGPGARA